MIRTTRCARRTAVLLALAAMLSAPAYVAAQRPAPSREITRIADDLYRASNGNWYAIFLVTSEGIVLGDPLNPAFADWLRGELDRRFDVPVRYVVYSHSHFDHAEGGAAFADTATFVAHENMLRNMDGRFPQMPGNMIDRNGNGQFDPEEIDIPTFAHPGVCGMGPGFFERYDHDGNGLMSPAELQRDIVRPDIVYSDRMSITLGGQRIELLHPGLNHSNDATVMLFPRQRVLFATEFLADALVTDNVHSLPSACGAFDGSPLSQWLQSYRAVEALDFDIVAPGHGDVFDKRGVTDTRVFFEDLVSAVEAGIAAGQSRESLRETITLDAYSDWENYERLLQDNIGAAFDNLNLYRD